MFYLVELHLHAEIFPPLGGITRGCFSPSCNILKNYKRWYLSGRETPLSALLTSPLETFDYCRKTPLSRRSGTSPPRGRKNCVIYLNYTKIAEIFPPLGGNQKGVKLPAES